MVDVMNSGGHFGWLSKKNCFEKNKYDHLKWMSERKLKRSTFNMNHQERRIKLKSLIEKEKKHSRSRRIRCPERQTS